MNRGLILKAVRETWPATLFFGLALFLVEMALAFVLPRFAEQIAAQGFPTRLFQTFARALLGTAAAERIGPDVLPSIAWVHPAVLALVWGHAIVCATRVPAGEIDRGTIDVLLGLPVSRWELHLSETVVWLLSAPCLLELGFLGNTLGGLGVLGASRPAPGRAALVLVNLLALQLTVGAFAWLLSALSDRRGRAMAIAFVAVLASFVLNYLAQFWEPAERVSFLSILSYYRPLSVLRDGAAPLGDSAILLTLAALFWTAAGVISSRRDLTTV